MNLPEGFITKYQQLLGDQADAFLASFDQPVVNGFRVNPLWPDAKIDLPTDQPIDYSEWGYLGKVDGNAIDHVAGYVYSQEPSAQFVGTVAAPRANEWVLDLCAAPGGKTTHLASYLGDSGLLVSNEINAGRAKILASNVERFGLTNTIVTNNDPATLAAAWPETFDRILVDAPCSGEGMFRKDPEAIRYWTPDYPATCAARQREILTEAVKMLKPGGTLVYSTCTFSPEEDEQIIAWVKETYGFAIEPIAKTDGMVDGHPEWANDDPELKNTARLFPHLLVGEGHFVAKLVKPGELTEDHPVVPAKATMTKPQSTDFQTFVTTSLNQSFVGQFMVRKEQLFILPSQVPDLMHVRLVRPGIHLGMFKKNRFEPSHTLATLTVPHLFKQEFDVDDAEYQRYRHGETLVRELPGKQFVRLTKKHKGFAIGHLVNDTIKNLYPKGLRV